MGKLGVTLALTLGCLMALQGQVRADELPQQLIAGEHRMLLNGSGVRTKAFLPLYTAGLYLTRPASSATQVIAADEPMALRIKITSSFVSQSSLVSSLEEGFENATGGNTQTLREQISQFRQCFEESIQKGDVFDLVYVPEHGVIVNKNGKLKGVVRGTEFKRALYGIWLSDKPADNALKQALLTPSKVR